MGPNSDFKAKAFQGLLGGCFSPQAPSTEISPCEDCTDSRNHKGFSANSRASELSSRRPVA